MSDASQSTVWRVKLPPNNSFQYRFAVFVRHTTLSTIPIGVLTVTEMNGVGSSKKNVRKYAVIEIPESAKDDERVFRISKPDNAKLKAGQDQHYHVSLSTRRPASECECHGYQRDGTCVHVVALRDLLLQGALKKGGQS